MKQYLKNLDEEKLQYIFEIQQALDAKEITLQQARSKIKERYQTITPYEIAYIEQTKTEMQEEECLIKDIQSMLDLYLGMIDTSRPTLSNDHPIQQYYLENDELRQILLAIEDLVQYPIIKNQWFEIYDKLKEYKKHLSRKQNQLYSVLEQKGFTRPTTTMWTLDDFIYDEIKEFRNLLETDEDLFIKKQITLVEDIRDLITKEESVLYPTSLAMIKSDEFEQMKSGDAEIGYAWINAPKIESKASFQDELASLLSKHGYSLGNQEVLDVATGKLTLNQINLIYKHLPVDISYVDENEIVKFYSDTDHRVFPRSKNVIGRDVKNCHPKKSVHIVEEIIDKFRKKEQRTAEFWINKPDLFIYIYYVAVLDENGEFRGVLEMMQDCTHIRSLQGSQTLLNWGDGSSQVIPSEQTESESETDLNHITPETKLAQLIKQYPDLKKKLPQISEKFNVINTPLARIMLPKATIEMMAERSGMDVNELIQKLNEVIKQQ